MSTFRTSWVVWLPAAMSSLLAAGCGITPSEAARSEILSQATARRWASNGLERALERGRELDSAERYADSLEKYLQAAVSASTVAGGQSDAAYFLGQAREEASHASSRGQAAGIMEAAMKRAIEALKFSPIYEAPLSEGFPPPSLPGLIRVKTYPAAERAMIADSWQDQLFMELFRKSNPNSFDTTIPIEMPIRDGRLRPPEEGLFAMAFYYNRYTPRGPAGKFQVVESKPITVVTLAIYGPYANQAVQGPLAKLQDWLRRHGEYEQAANPRLLAYNSNQVIWFRRYGELQIPIRRADGAE